MTQSNYIFFVDKLKENNLKKTQIKFTKTLATFYFDELSTLEENLSTNTTLLRVELFIPNIKFNSKKLHLALTQNIDLLKLLIYKYTSKTEHELYINTELEELLQTNRLIYECLCKINQNKIPELDNEDQEKVINKILGLKVKIAPLSTLISIATLLTELTFNVDEVQENALEKKTTSLIKTLIEKFLDLDIKSTPLSTLKSLNSLLTNLELDLSENQKETFKNQMFHLNKVISTEEEKKTNHNFASLHF